MSRMAPRRQARSRNTHRSASESSPMLRVGAIATGRRTLAIGCLIAWSAIAWSCKSDPAPAERTSDDPPIVAVKIDRARVARNNASVEPRPALPPHPTDPVEPIESDVATPSTVASADAAARREASGDASSGSSSAMLIMYHKMWSFIK